LKIIQDKVMSHSEERIPFWQFFEAPGNSLNTVKNLNRW